MNLQTSNDPFPPDPITPPRAANLADVSLPTIYRRIQRGQLRAWKDVVSGRLRVSRSDVVALWRVREVRPAPARFAGLTPRQRAARERRRAEEKAAATAALDRMGV
jgi:excisionase family DNA binding protein